MNRDARIWAIAADDQTVDAAQQSARAMWELVIRELLPLHADLSWDNLRFYMTGQNGRTVLYPARQPVDSNRWVRGAISMSWPRMESVYAEVDHIDPARRDADGEWLDEEEWAQRAKEADEFVINALESTYPEYADRLPPVLCTVGEEVVRRIGKAA